MSKSYKISVSTFDTPCSIPPLLNVSEFSNLSTGFDFHKCTSRPKPQGSDFKDRGVIFKDILRDICKITKTSLRKKVKIIWKWNYYDAKELKICTFECKGGKERNSF